MASYQKMILAVLLLCAYMPQTSPERPPSEVWPKAPELSTAQQLQAYSYGVAVGGYLKNVIGLKHTLLDSMEPELVLQGIRDASLAKPRLPQADVEQHLRPLGMAYQQHKQLCLGGAAKQQGRLSAAFLAEHAKRPNVVTTDSGLQYEVLTAGRGIKPLIGDSVMLHYLGFLPDGSTFANSYKENAPVQLLVERAIEGWIEVLQLMSEGAIFKVVLPPGLAYGQTEMGKIPPNSVVIFEIELLQVTTVSAENSGS